MSNFGAMNLHSGFFFNIYVFINSRKSRFYLVSSFLNSTADKIGIPELSINFLQLLH
jgi:hypothetical protein